MSPKSKGGARDRLRQYFLSHIGEVLDGKTLREVAGGISEWARRVRELRNEEGLQILTHNDRNTLAPGQYLLEEPKPGPAFARDISKETRALVLDRNGFTCQMCGASAGETHPNDPAGRKVRLHISHIIDKSNGGADTPENLRALCSLCNEGSQNVSAMRPDLRQLLVLIRRANRADQIAALKWLKQKYPSEPGT